MLKKFSGVLTGLIVFLAILSSSSIISNTSAQVMFPPPIDVSLVANAINMTRIEGHVEGLSSFETRVTGYPGCEAAADYIEKAVNEIGLKVERHIYPLLIPVDQGTNVTIFPQEVTYEAYAIWPNGIQTCFTPDEGIEGKIFYVGKGRLVDFDGLDVEDSIVLMDFDSGGNWINAAKLGARAAIFIGSPDTIRTEAEQKFIWTPLYFPRIYLPGDQGLELMRMVQLGEVSRVNVRSKMLWQQRTAENLLVEIPGQELPDEILMVGAYYDSWSFVPKLSPGADEALSPAVLLELAELLLKFPPKRTVWLVFFSGHWQSMAGGRNFVEDFFFQNQTFASGTRKILMNMGVLLSSDSDKLCFKYNGNYFSMEGNPVQGGGGGRPLSLDYLYKVFFTSWIPVFRSELPYNFSDHVQDWQASVVARSEWFESEIVSQAGVTASTFLSTDTLRIRVGTPFDTHDRISWRNLEPQIMFVLPTLMGLANQEYANTEVYSMWRTAVRFSFGRTGAGGKGYAGLCNLIGRVEEYNMTSGFYSPVPGAIVEAFVQQATGRWANRLNPFARIYTLADENGEYRIPGVKGYDNGFGLYTVLAYVFDSADSSIIYAPDLGMYGSGGGGLAGYDFVNVEILTEPTFAKSIAFKCKSIVLYDIMNPLTLRENSRGLHFYTGDAEVLSTATTSVTLSLNDFISHGSPPTHGQVVPTDTMEPLAMIFVDPELRFEVVLTTSMPVLGQEQQRLPVLVGLLTNASQLESGGSGYYSNVDKFTAFDYVRDCVYLNDPRYQLTLKYKMLSPPAKEYYALSRLNFERAVEALEQMQYTEAYNYLWTSWNFETNAYAELRSSLQDLTRTSITITALIVPFAIIFERIMFPTSGLKRVIEIIGIMASALIVSYFLHPGFALASNIVAAVLGLLVLFVTLPVIAIILDYMRRFAKEIRIKLLGLHFAEIARGEALVSAIVAGASNMRKRPLRTFLNLMTVSIIVFSLVTFTSASSFRTVKGFATEEEAPYKGMMLVQNGGMTPFSPQILSLLRSSLGSEAVIAPRSWAFLPSPGDTGDVETSWTAGIASLNAPSQQFNEFGHIYGANGTKATVRSLLGLTIEELDVTDVEGALMSGSRFFVRGEVFSCIVPQAVQSKLGIQVGDRINVKGVSLVVVGIADMSMLSGVLDLNGESIAPNSPEKLAGAGATQQVSYSPAILDQVVIVPFELAHDVFNGRMNTVAVNTENFTALEEVLRLLVLGTFEDLEIYVSTEEGNVEVWRRGTEVLFERANTVIVPTVIGGLTMLVTLLGSVYERKREMAIFSTVGLSPLHVTGMFLAESLTYAICGSVFGYLAGLTGIDALVMLQFIPEGVVVNFSSTFVLIAIGFSMFLVMASAVYPALRAGLMVTPSLRRKWEISTKPIGDDWIIPLPFVSKDEEVDAVLRYISEYLDMYTSTEMGLFFVRRREMQEDLKAETPRKEIALEVSLAPWDTNTIQDLYIRAFKEKKKEKDWSFQVHVKFLQGNRTIWETRNPNVVDVLRKQFLLWRTIGEEERDKYHAD